MRNWAGNVVFEASSVVQAETVEEVQALVRRGGRVRPLGTRHSFNHLADTDGTQVTVLGLPADPVLDETAGELTIGAGITYGVAARHLADRGWALPNMGSLPHISIGGAVATGTSTTGRSRPTRVFTDGSSSSAPAPVITR